MMMRSRLPQKPTLSKADSACRVFLVAPIAGFYTDYRTAEEKEAEFNAFEDLRDALLEEIACVND